MKSLIRKKIDQSVSIYDVYRKIYGFVPMQDTVHCLFHEDARKSAKIYHDEDGDRLFCYTEGKQYTISDILILNGQDLTKWLPKEEVESEFVVRNEQDLSYLEGFKNNEFTFKEFCQKWYEASVGVDACGK